MLESQHEKNHINAVPLCSTCDGLLCHLASMRGRRGQLIRQFDVYTFNHFSKLEEPGRTLRVLIRGARKCDVECLEVNLAVTSNGMPALTEKTIALQTNAVATVFKCPAIRRFKATRI